MSKHTPGAWHVTDRAIAGIGIGCEDGTIAVVLTGWPYLPDPEANARLIAKAPELYEALRDCLPGKGEKFYAWHDRARALLAEIDGDS